MKRLLSVILLLSIFAAGCASKPQRDSAPAVTSPRETQTVPTAPEEAPVEQAQLSQEELALIMQNTEYSLLAAAFLYDAYRDVEDDWYGRFAYVGDADKDGQNEMYYSESLLYFDPSDGKSCRYTYSPSGNHGLYLSKTGSVFTSYYGENDYIVHGDHEDSVSVLGYWCKDPDGTSFSVCEPWCRDGQRDSWVRLKDRDLTAEESEAFLQQLGLTPVATGLQDYTAFTYDAAYTDSILEELETAFGIYYYGSYALDVDRDGEEERLYFYKDLVPAWIPQQAFNPTPGDYDTYMDHAYYFDYPGIDPDADRTGLIVADRQDKELVLKAYSVPMQPAWYEDSAAYIQGTALHLYGTDWIAPQAATGLQDQLTILDKQLQQKNYTNGFFATADLSDADQEEILFLGCLDGVWKLLVIRFEYGMPIVLEKVDLSQSACYLTEADGGKCLLIYSQSVSRKDEGLYTGYSYRLMRFDGDESDYVLDSGYVGYYNDQEDAKSVSDFFDALNRYIAKVTVLRDPFTLHGQQWISPEKVAHGTAPQEPESTEPDQPAQPEQPSQEQEEKLGFVNISNPSSWLNLREGPGREYPCIRTDPDDPGSIVKQAKGSPVTVLETVDSQDEEFPVWYKVRIRYQDRDIVGYSAEAYIKLAQ